MKIVVKRGIGMVKQSPLQSDLFNNKYIEDQVKKIKESLDEKKADSKTDELEEKLSNILKDQLSILQDIQFILSEIEKNTHKKRRWFD